MKAGFCGRQASNQDLTPKPIPTVPFPPCRPINPSIDREELSRTVRAVILAGGEAKNPLTRSRAMPAVPLGSSLMMIDVPISNCMSAGINKMWAEVGLGDGVGGAVGSHMLRMMHGERRCLIVDSEAGITVVIL